MKIILIILIILVTFINCKNSIDNYDKEFYKLEDDDIMIKM